MVDIPCTVGKVVGCGGGVMMGMGRVVGKGGGDRL